MRKLRYSVAMSLDGFIADPMGGYDWIIMDDSIDFAAMFAEFDTFVMGRKTYEVTAQHPEFISLFGGNEVIVFSKTLKALLHPGIRIIDTNPVETVRELKAKSGKDIWLFGGGQLFRSLVDAGVVDTVEVAIMPVLLGDGVPVLAPGKQVSLKLEKYQTRPESGIVSLSYSL